MKLAFLVLAVIILWLSAEFHNVSGRPHMTVTTKVCDAREFLTLYQRTCTYYGKRGRKSNIVMHYGALRVERDLSNDLELDPAPELARKCCQDGCSVHLIGLHCNNI